MNRIIKSVVVAACAVLCVSGSVFASGSAGTWKKDITDGTVTLWCNLDGDSATSLGVDYRSDSAVFTPWVNVPVGIDFLIYTEVRDADSAKAFGPDTVHIGLFTAPIKSFAVDSVNIRHQNKQQLLWDYGSLNWRTFQQQTYFQMAHADTNSLDTLATAATSLKSTATGGKTYRKNCGMLRFGLTMDDSDSLTDSGVRFRCFIIYKEQNPLPYRGSLDDADSYGNVTPGVEAVLPSWASVDRRYTKVN